MPRKPPAPSESADYRRWKARCAGLLLRLDVPAGPWSRERDLRQMYIGGATPEQAAEEVQMQYTPARSSACGDDLPFRVVRSNGTDEVLARAVNLINARGAYREAVRMYRDELIEPRQGVRIIERSK